MGQEVPFNSAPGFHGPSYATGVPLSSPISWVDLGPVFPVLFLAPSPAAPAWTPWVDLIPGCLVWVCQWVQVLLPALPALLRRHRALPGLVRATAVAPATPSSSSHGAVPLYRSPRPPQDRCLEKRQQQDSSEKKATRQKPETEAFM